jgi:hypothetical protein
LAQAGMVEMLFEDFDGDLKDQGYLARPIHYKVHQSEHQPGVL